MFFQILRRSGATNVMLVTLLIPVTAILLGYLVLGEKHLAARDRRRAGDRQRAAADRRARAEILSSAELRAGLAIPASQPVNRPLSRSPPCQAACTAPSSATSTHDVEALGAAQRIDLPVAASGRSGRRR